MAKKKKKCYQNIKDEQRAYKYPNEIANVLRQRFEAGVPFEKWDEFACWFNLRECFLNPKDWRFPFFGGLCDFAGQRIWRVSAKYLSDIVYFCSVQGLRKAGEILVHKPGASWNICPSYMRWMTPAAYIKACYAVEREQSRQVSPGFWVTSPRKRVEWDGIKTTSPRKAARLKKIVAEAREELKNLPLAEDKAVAEFNRNWGKYFTPEQPTIMNAWSTAASPVNEVRV